MALKRGYCPQCLRDLGLEYTEQQLLQLEIFKQFPRRIGPEMWDAEEVDDWIEQRDGERPKRPTCH